MLQTYKSINSSILNLNDLSRYLVIDYWLKGNRNYSLIIDPTYQKLIKNLPKFHDDIKSIYKSCRDLTLQERRIIRISFINQNSIKKLCEGKTKLLTFSEMPSVVEKKMKPFFVKLYEEYSDRKTMSSQFDSKKAYFDALYTENGFIDCPCCGMNPFESDKSDYREDFDHYLPKSEFVFSSVNYQNLIPLCKKCNSTYKGDINPVEGGRKAFYPYSNKDNCIDVKIILDKDVHQNICDISLTGSNQEEINTWNDLFSIKNRYEVRANQIKKKLITRLKKHMRETQKDFNDTSSFYLNLLDTDKYEESNIVKISLIKSFLLDENFKQQMNI